MADLTSADGGLRELALFAGAGGGILGGKLLGWRTVCAVEREPYAASVLAQRQNDGLLPPFPIWDDVCTFDGRPWRGIVDVVSGGFPCQDISAAGKGAGIDGERSGLWGEMARIIGEVRPRYVFVENSPLLVGRGLARVLGDLAAMGFDAEWGVLGAHDVGAPHRRERCWIVANATGEQHEGTAHAKRGATGAELLADAEGQRCGEARELRHKQPTERASSGCKIVADTYGERQQELHAAALASEARQHPWGVVEGWREDWWTTEPDVGRVADGVAARVDRLKAIGNGQVPQCAAEAWRILTHNGPSNRPASAGPG